MLRSETTKSIEYYVFIQNKTDEIKLKNPGISNHDLLKEIAMEWIREDYKRSNKN